MTTNLPRHGTYSNSNVWKLMTMGTRDMTEQELFEHKKLNPKSKRKTIQCGWGAPALKYIKQVQYEIDLGRAINREADSRPTSWGEIIERRVFDLLPLEYRLVSKERLIHPTISTWTGAPDLLKDNTVCDVKCAVSLEVFCDKMKALEDIEGKYKEEFPEDYWQLVGGSVLTDSEYAEAINYVPFLDEIPEIKEMVSNFDGNVNKVAWIAFVEDEYLPYLIKGKKYQNLNITRFRVPEEDKKLLTTRIVEASKLLVYPKEEKTTVFITEGTKGMSGSNSTDTSTSFPEGVTITIGTEFVKSLPPIAPKEARSKARKKLEGFKAVKNKKNEISE